MATNYLSAFILSTELQPHLEKTAQNYGEARIVNISSEAHAVARQINWDDLNYQQRKYTMFRAYGESKALMIVLTQEQARRISTPNLTVNSMHPGTVNTNIVSSGGSWFLTLGYKIVGRFMMTPAQSAKAVCHVALAPELKASTGNTSTSAS